ncbi:MAG: hypothetical protein DSY59_05755 [Persephonella sp.]|nr:MAG: hypothetical protein DSY59_05755 [Persephonella sp.]RUM58886.1 MAG: hypothetical protein DSY60_00840 [Persephonella sp.]
MATGRTLEALRECILFAKEELGEGLISSDIYSDDGLPVVEGHNGNPKAAALFANITDYIRKAVVSSNFPNLGDYYMVNLEDDRLVIVLLTPQFQWKMLIDHRKIKLGYLFSIFFPEAIKRFKEAVNVV